MADPTTVLAKLPTYREQQTLNKPEKHSGPGGGGPDSYIAAVGGHPQSAGQYTEIRE
jgi:hypothetical protein